MGLTWNGARATAQIKARLLGGMTQAGEELRDGIKADISIQGPPRSTPGSPPHKDTGALERDYWAQTVMTARDTITTRVGSSMEYDPYLEFGTPTMAPRPHARQRLITMWAYLVSIIFS